MAIWEYTDFETKDLEEMLEMYEKLEQTEGEQDEDMMRELRAELEKREEQNG